MATAKNGDTVSIHYTGKLADGSIFDSSLEREPLEFILGAGVVIPGFDKAVLGMNTGESKTVTIPVKDAYGERHEQMNMTVEKTQLPPDIKPEIGMMLQVNTEDGNVAHVIIASMTDTEVTLDGNHPLAGKDLTFDLNLVSVK